MSECSSRATATPPDFPKATSQSCFETATITPVSRDRSQISNYERGRFLPSEEFLTSFIEAVKPRLAERGIELTEKDANHLLYIAGYASQTDVDVHELRTTVSEGQERLHAGMTDVRVGQERLQGGLLAPVRTRLELHKHR